MRLMSFRKAINSPLVGADGGSSDGEADGEAMVMMRKKRWRSMPQLQSVLRMLSKNVLVF